MSEGCEERVSSICFALGCQIISSFYDNIHGTDLTPACRGERYGSREEEKLGDDTCFYWYLPVAKMIPRNLFLSAFLRLPQRKQGKNPF